MNHHFSNKLFPSTAPFSHFVSDNNLGFISGIIAQGPLSGELVNFDFEQQVRQTLDNFSILLAELKLDKSNVLRTCIYVTNYDHFSLLNEIYSSYFTAPFPARTTLAVAGLPLGAKIQIDAIVRL